MPTILKNERRSRLLAFCSGRRTGLRLTSDAIDQLQEQLRFNAAEREKQITGLLHETVQARLEMKGRRRLLLDALERGKPERDGALKRRSKEARK